MNPRYLVLPGVGGSGPEHWQTLWERCDTRFQRVQQRDWDNPVCSAWVSALEGAVKASGPDVVLVAHSLGCLLAAHWAEETHLKIRAALLVAVPDPSGPNFPQQATGFFPLPQKKLPFQSLLVASSDDPYGSIDFAGRCSSVWGSTFKNVGAAGHINASSNLGEWSEGRRLLESLVA
jgi:predicted alpha/beta hydrolase family esterase